MRFNILLSFVLIAIGILMNQWLLAWLIPPSDGTIALPNRIVIWFFQILLIVGGLATYFKGSTSEGRRWLLFRFCTVVVVISMVELGLHAIGFVRHFFKAEEINDKRYLLSPYEGKEWAKVLFSEFSELTCDYEPFVEWRRKEYHGKHINIDAQGFRQTWNPEHCQGQGCEKIYVFGGSTLLGTGARDDYTIPSCLSKRFAAADLNCIFVNCGETGYVFDQEIICLALLLKDGHQPTHVIFYDGVNDCYAAYQSGMAGTIQNLQSIRDRLTQTHTKRPINLIVSGFYGILQQHCMIYRAIVAGLTALSGDQFQEVCSSYTEKELKVLSDCIAENYLQCMDLLDHLSQAYGFKYACFWQPVALTKKTLTEEETQSDRRLKDKALAKLFKHTLHAMKTKSPSNFYNLSDALANCPNSYYIDFCHLSEDGNGLIADRMFQILSKVWVFE